MQFLVIATDYPDALERRLACREAHVHLIDDLKAKGHFHMGGAILNDTGDMVGSALVCDFPSEDALKTDWLAHEPYLLDNVWETVTIQPYRIGPSFN